jgi:nucleoside-diphosphate-sugar epimerase
MNILITGAFGFIGTALLKHLEGNITAIDNFFYKQYNLPLAFPSITYYNQDVCTVPKELVENQDVIIHLASLVGQPVCDRYPEVASAVNLDATKRLVDMLRPEQKLIYPNTNSSYGTTSGEEFCTEESPFNPISLYAKDKCASEKYILEKHANSITLRLATLFSLSLRPRLDLLVNDFCYKAYFDKKIDIYEPHFKRNFIHIEDVCHCFMFCVENFYRLRGQCYNVGLDSANMSKIELAKAISEIIPCEINICDGSDIDKRNYIVSSQKIYNAGWSPRYSLQDGIATLKQFFALLPQDKEKRELSVKNMRNA